jgi:hypothetical protein
VLTTTADAVVNGVNIGIGAGAITTNTRIGASALRANTTGASNTALGFASLFANTTGSQNTSIGRNALVANTTGANNTAIGHNSLVNLSSGSGNTALGSLSGRFIADGTTDLTSSDNSVFIGGNIRANANSQTNQIVIGHTAIGLGSNTTVIGNSSTTFGRWYGSLLLGTTTNAASSILTMESTTQGFLPPRMTTTQRNAIASPATGLVVYDTTLNDPFYYNGTAWTMFQDALTNPVTGTGTTNYLPKFTGSTTIGNSQVFDNGTNVGIGTGSSGGGRLNIQNIASNPVINIRSTNNVFDILTMTFDESTDLFSITNKQAFAQSGIAFGTNNLERVRITQPGNLLVGTTTDAGYKLDVNGTGRFTSNLTVTAAGADQIRTLSLQGTNGASELYQFNLVADGENAVARFMVGVGGGTPTERMRIASTGAATFSSSVTAGGAATNYGTLQIMGGATSASLTVGTAANTILAFSPGQELAITGNNAAPFGISFQGRNSLAGGGPSGTTYPILFNPLGGNVLIGTATNGASKLRIVGLPTSAAGLSSGDVYNLSGVLMIA